MMRRRIFLWMGLGVLFTIFCFSQTALAKETYRVQQGDTLTSIARTSGVEVSALIKANGLRGSRLRVHQVLVIPTVQNQKPTKTIAARPDLYTVRKGDTLSAIADRAGLSVADLKRLNQLKGHALHPGQRLALRERPVQSALAVELDDEEEDGGLLAAPTVLEDAVQERESLLGNWSTPEEPQLLAKVAMGFLGAPYRLGGSSVTGIDCSAFVKKIYQMFNIELPRTAFEQSRVGMRVPRSELTVGDLLFFKTKRSVGHVGIYVGNNEFVHASSRKRGVRIDNLSTPYYDQRFVRAVRLKDLDGRL